MNRPRNRKPVHPGQTFLNDVLQPLNLSISDAAVKLAVSRKHLSLFINGHIPCSKDMATRLGKATNTSMASWLNMQTTLDVWEAENEQTDDKYDSVQRLKA